MQRPVADNIVYNVCTMQINSVKYPKCITVLSNNNNNNTFDRLNRVYLKYSPTAKLPQYRTKLTDNSIVYHGYGT